MISQYQDYCVGYGSAGVEGVGYVMGLVLGVGRVQKELSHEGSQVLDGINAFDRAEVEETYLGQINMITVSSFCGPDGMLWGYDLARAEGLYDSKLGEVEGLVYYSAEPLLGATKSLFGTVEAKRFPLLPGSHVPSASKYITKEGPGELYAAVGVGIPKNREESAILMMEDVGESKGISENDLLEKLAMSFVRVGDNQQVDYQEVFLAVKRIVVEEGEVGSALAAAPYLALARKAVPASGVLGMTKLSLSQWERIVYNEEKLCYLPLTALLPQ